MSVHKLTAGSGYDYLTRQVAAHDATEKGHTSLASYYTEKGEAPGRWVGAGMAGLEGLDSGDAVTAEQMHALFAYGLHPLAGHRIADLEHATLSGEGPLDEDAVRAAQRLGTPFKIYNPDVPEFQVEVARRIEAENKAAGRTTKAPAPLQVRARVRSRVAAEFFAREHGRAPADARELAATVARHTRPRTTAVAGYDLTFSPVKSVSALWAIADPPVAAAIERAHDAAVGDALRFIEEHALFTRTGTNGVRQVDVRGLVAAAFTHRDSRAGDPDLHTHVAVANKVQTTTDGRWLAIDGRLIFKANVAASETYNTALERHLHAALGLRFAEREQADPRKRPVREVVGVEPGLNERWSARRAGIEVRRAELATQFQATHRRPPTPVEAIQLAQQATLETREAKHESRSLAEQRTTWRAEAAQVLGGTAAVEQMVARVLSPADNRRTVEQVDAAWVRKQGRAVVERVGAGRSTWQIWHLRAEAQRRVRVDDATAQLAPADLSRVVDLVVDAAVAASEPVSTDLDPVADPAILRRRDGSSVYTVAGSHLFTSTAILAAEARIVAAGTHLDGRSLDPEVVDLALAESAMHGVTLNTGQAAMVRQMTTTGARVQLGIAAAGTGKTTAMSVLTRAWEDGGGTVLGLAPSAAAAATLGEQTRAAADTLAKFVIDQTSDARDGLHTHLGPRTLVLVDEAGMADTPSLDIVITAALEAGASVRLIGDDQQLAAIGSGGVLRDIDHLHGAVRLAELQRFADPAEGAATLALREGRPEALGYYLDHDRVRVGDQPTLVDQVFTAWRNDQHTGLDSLMLAPTRELVTDLNARARAARVTTDIAAVPGDVGNSMRGDSAGGVEPGTSVRLGDGNHASVGDKIITRRNDRRLRVSATDWVKNGDRWHVTGLQDDGAGGVALAVRHATSGLVTTLPADYVRTHVDLGYACTVHSAQGVTADTVHGLVEGTENRQQLYTLATRGRHANHLYLVTADDGDPHNLVRPETTHPTTAVEVLERVLARDGSAVSATTQTRQAAAPAAQLTAAAARYTDAVHVGAETLVGADRLTQIESAAEDLVPGVGDEPAWPVLRAHLVLLEAHGRDAVADLGTVVAERPLDGVKDRAAILDWRLDPTGQRGRPAGPLPWLPSIPARLADHAGWGPYLGRRAHRVSTLADRVRSDATTTHQTPGWARQGTARPGNDLLGDIAVWRAATAVADHDRRPTGPRQQQKAAATQQQRLTDRLEGGHEPAMAEWGPTLDALHPSRDDFTHLLATRLAALSRSGVEAGALLRDAAAEGPLPDEHVAAALWWRITAHLSPTVATEAASTDHRVEVAWSDMLVDVLGEQPTGRVTTSPWWPTLVTQVDHALDRGWSLTDLMDLIGATGTDDVDLAQALVWRVGLVTSTPPDEAGDHHCEQAPDDVDVIFGADASDLDIDVGSGLRSSGGDQSRMGERVDAHPAVNELAAAAAARDLLGPLQPTDRTIGLVEARAYEWDHAPVTGDRIVELNTAASRFYADHLDESWAGPYLRVRLGRDLAGDDRFGAGWAPDTWTALTDHLRATCDAADHELVAAGLAKTASTGRLIDRFRDRAVVPIRDDRARVLGFVGRRNPEHDRTATTRDHRHGPKYLNTPETVVFHKGAQLYLAGDAHTAEAAIPTLVEGPLDAIAVTLATGGTHLGVAPLGTSLTDEQATQLALLARTVGQQPIVATDGDLAGRLAAERDYWLLTQHGLDPCHAALPEGQDPASLLTEHGAVDVAARLFQARPLAETLLRDRVSEASVSSADDPIVQPAAIGAWAHVVAARPPTTWVQTIQAHVDAGLTSDADTLRAAVAAAAEQINDDRRRFAGDRLGETAAVRARLETNRRASPSQRWAPLARRVDPQLLTEPDWPATASMLDDLASAGHDVEHLTRTAAATQPLGQEPARELRYRLVGHVPDQPTTTSLTSEGRREADGRRTAVARPDSGASLNPGRSTEPPRR